MRNRCNSKTDKILAYRATLKPLWSHLLKAFRNNIRLFTIDQKKRVLCYEFMLANKTFIYLRYTHTK